MTTLLEDVTVIGGIDTHKHTHYAAAIDNHGRLLGHQQFPLPLPDTKHYGPGCAAMATLHR